MKTTMRNQLLISTHTKLINAKLLITHGRSRRTTMRTNCSFKLILKCSLLRGYQGRLQWGPDCSFKLISNYSLLRGYQGGLQLGPDCSFKLISNWLLLRGYQRGLQWVPNFSFQLDKGLTKIDHAMKIGVLIYQLLSGWPPFLPDSFSTLCGWGSS